MSSDQPGYPCPCCGHLTFGGPPGSFEICPVCFWEDDYVQLRWPDWSGGANRPNLIEAQEVLRQIGSCEESLLAHVRPGHPDEPIDLKRDSFEPRDQEPVMPAPSDLTALYWWRPTF